MSSNPVGEYHSGWVRYGLLIIENDGEIVLLVLYELRRFEYRSTLIIRTSSDALDKGSEMTMDDFSQSCATFELHVLLAEEFQSNSHATFKVHI